MERMANTHLQFRLSIVRPGLTLVINHCWLAHRPFLRDYFLEFLPPYSLAARRICLPDKSLTLAPPVGTDNLFLHFPLFQEVVINSQQEYQDKGDGCNHVD